MNTRGLLIILLMTAGLVLVAGCSQPGQPGGNTNPVMTATAAPALSAPPTTITPADLTARVKEAVLYARENGKEKALFAFNDPKGRFARDNIYIFAEDYHGMALAEPFEPAIVGTNIANMTDRFGVPVVRHFGETAGYGIGYVSYDYQNPANNNTVEPRLSAVADADGTYYVGAGRYAGGATIYPSTVIGLATRQYTTEELTVFVKGAVAFAKENGREEAFAAFSNPTGRFADGELAIIAVDYNGTVLAGSVSPGGAEEKINLINFHDPDGVATIREKRDLSLQGGGFSYTVAAWETDGKTYYAPKIEYAEPVDGTYWIFSGIIVPEYEQLREGNLTGIPLRKHTREDLYDLVDRAVVYAKTNGKEPALAEIADPNGSFVEGDLFVWAESFDGIILADPYWKEGIGENWMSYSDSFGAKTTVTGINTIRNGTGFTHTMFPDTSTNSTKHVPKLVFMKAVDGTWWIGGGIYGVQVR